MRLHLNQLTFSFFVIINIFSSANAVVNDNTKPNIILLMTDDQGWGQTGYYNHPILKTPNLDAMAKNGLRLDRFYAGGPNCSPTRSSILTGRSNDRVGVPDHGYALRLQEKTIAQALKTKGYKTGHFGKWHLNAIRGSGVPILQEDKYHPGVFGFDEWLTVTNYFDINPIMGRNGQVEEFKGDSSNVIVTEALKFIQTAKQQQQPFLAVIWDGSPHAPFVASDEDRSAFKALKKNDQQHYGELVAFDRSVGLLRKKLREMKLADNTIIWYCSDNGGLKGITPEAVGGLRGYKSLLWEGGIRVPAIIEWPSVIEASISQYPASTMDIFPTIADITNLPESAMIQPIDGTSLLPQMRNQSKNTEPRTQVIPFRFRDQAALIDNQYKLISMNRHKGSFLLFDLEKDPKESIDISQQHPKKYQQMLTRYKAWNTSVNASIKGKDYPEGKLTSPTPKRRSWKQEARYQPFINNWQKRPEYAPKFK